MEIAENTTTDIIGSNEKTPGEGVENTTLTGTNFGAELELKATGVSGSGSMHNVKVGEEHVATGTGTITYTGVEVVKPAGIGCKVFTDIEATKTPGEEKVVHTRPLKATTAGQGDALKFEPETGTVFATFFISGCRTAAFNRTYEVTGSVITSSIKGATSNFTEAQDHRTENAETRRPNCWDQRSADNQW